MVTMGHQVHRLAISASSVQNKLVLTQCIISPILPPSIIKLFWNPTWLPGFHKLKSNSKVWFRLLTPPKLKPQLATLSQLELDSSDLSLVLHLNLGANWQQFFPNRNKLKTRWTFFRSQAWSEMSSWVNLAPSRPYELLTQAPLAPFKPWRPWHLHPMTPLKPLKPWHPWYLLSRSDLLTFDLDPSLTTGFRGDSESWSDLALDLEPSFTIDFSRIK